MMTVAEWGGGGGNDDAGNGGGLLVTDQPPLRDDEPIPGVPSYLVYRYWEGDSKGEYCLACNRWADDRHKTNQKHRDRADEWVRQELAEQAAAAAAAAQAQQQQGQQPQQQGQHAQ